MFSRNTPSAKDGAKSGGKGGREERSERAQYDAGTAAPPVINDSKRGFALRRCGFEGLAFSV